MVEIPDRLRYLFTARVDDRNGACVVEVPTKNERQAVSPSETYRVVVLPELSRGKRATHNKRTAKSTNSGRHQSKKTRYAR